MKRASISNQRRTLFLAGTRGYSTWRTEVEKMVSKNYLCRNPMEIEDADKLFKYRRDSDFIVYVLCPSENEMYKCIAELVDDANNKPLYTLVLIMEEDNGIMWTPEERDELIKLAQICNIRSVRGGVFYNIKDLCEYLNKH